MRRVIFSLMVGMLVLLGSVGSAEGVATLFTDDFSGYLDGQLNQANSPWIAPWLGAGAKVRNMWVGPATGDKAVLEGNYSGNVDVAYVPGANTLEGVLQSDYIVRGAWTEHPELGDMAIRAEIAGRVQPDGSFISAAVNVNWPPDVFVQVYEVDGPTGARTRIGAMRKLGPLVPGEPIFVSLVLAGDSATAYAHHAGTTVSRTATTTILGAGSPGFTGYSPWGSNHGAVLDNFKVVEIPEPATMILLGLGLSFVGLKALKKKKA